MLLFSTLKAISTVSSPFVIINAISGAQSNSVTIYRIAHLPVGQAAAEAAFQVIPSKVWKIQPRMNF
ncbi:hypothetical protein MWU60_08285 [Yoonia sp. F2084L]|uniref:hypothetical protein n=1 Tax=Yoonia sp. F2084L TaxID=2926419 RepID=UPI001FF675CA|nr:hypothetical protein [Yoonia sp. F2084L]MCK0095568.1 hypothetical protein [Yoonia sp. F2084L]